MWVLVLRVPFELNLIGYLYCLRTLSFGLIYLRESVRWMFGLTWITQLWVRDLVVRVLFEWVRIESSLITQLLWDNIIWEHTFIQELIIRSWTIEELIIAITSLGWVHPHKVILLQILIQTLSQDLFEFHWYQFLDYLPILSERWIDLKIPKHILINLLRCCLVRKWFDLGYRIVLSICCKVIGVSGIHALTPGVETFHSIFNLVHAFLPTIKLFHIDEVESIGEELRLNLHIKRTVSTERWWLVHF